MGLCSCREIQSQQHGQLLLCRKQRQACSTRRALWGSGWTKKKTLSSLNYVVKNTEATSVSPPFQQTFLCGLDWCPTPTTDQGETQTPMWWTQVCPCPPTLTVILRGSSFPVRAGSVKEGRALTMMSRQEKERRACWRGSTGTWVCWYCQIPNMWHTVRSASCDLSVTDESSQYCNEGFARPHERLVPNWH